MPDLLIELLSEEIPARMQRRASLDFEKLLTDGISELVCHMKVLLPSLLLDVWF